MVADSTSAKPEAVNFLMFAGGLSGPPPDNGTAFQDMGRCSLKRALFVLILVGCGGDLMEPSTPFLVAFSQSVTSKGFDAQLQREQCNYTFTAVASGGEVGDFALWGAIDIEFRFADGTIETPFVEQTEPVDFWGSDRIVTGSSVERSRFAFSSKTFTLFHTFRYSLATGEQRSAFVTVDCL